MVRLSAVLSHGLVTSLRQRSTKMGEEAPAPAAPAKAAKKKATKVKRSGPSISELILKAVSASKERNGVSLAALKKNLAADGYDVEKNKARVKIAVRGLVTKGTLVQTKGTGASGSFKMNKKAHSCPCGAACEHGPLGTGAQPEKSESWP
uniref:Histone H1 n=1 Tax=Takifugu rubripes TaxID=31033 RepID=H2RZH7_TAKRU